MIKRGKSSFDKRWRWVGDGGELVSYKDRRGYELSIVRGVAPGEEMIICGPRGDVNIRRGTCYVTSPEGETVQTTYWMDQVDPGWFMAEVDYRKLSDTERARLEVVELATDRGGLHRTFKFFVKCNAKYPPGG